MRNKVHGRNYRSSMVITAKYCGGNTKTNQILKAATTPE
jgi:hypothetical protein